MNETFRLIYTSLLAPDASPAVIADIVRRSRVNNRQSDITGVLVFDGMAFCQYLEGTATEVEALMAKILVDTRHIDVRIRCRGTVASPRRFASWSMAYGLHDTGSLVADLLSEPADPAVVVQRFDVLLSLVDLDPFS
jgi:hypothetical protein